MGINILLSLGPTEHCISLNKKLGNARDLNYSILLISSFIKLKMTFKIQLYICVLSKSKLLD